MHTIARNVQASRVFVTDDGSVFASEPGQHPDMPSRIWRITKDGHKNLIDSGLSSASGLAFSPDHQLFFAAEKSTQWIYSFTAGPNGTLHDKQQFYWLHMTDIPNNSGAEDLAVDAHGNLYVATRMGVQVCDQNGRVRAVLPLPAPSGAARSIAFGGAHLDELYVTDSSHLFRRRLKVSGVAPWAAPVQYASQGAG
jgi:sugar lactone lactonase YvrE